jgi:hypothetical protein
MGYQKYYQQNDKQKNNMNFVYKKVSFKQAITILAKNGIEVDDNEATVIVDFLYLMAKNYKKDEEEKVPKPQGEIELYKKTLY